MAKPRIPFTVRLSVWWQTQKCKLGLHKYGSPHITHAEVTHRRLDGSVDTEVRVVEMMDCRVCGHRGNWRFPYLPDKDNIN